MDWYTCASLNSLALRQHCQAAFTGEHVPQVRLRLRIMDILDQHGSVTWPAGALACVAKVCMWRSAASLRLDIPHARACLGACALTFCSMLCLQGLSLRLVHDICSCHAWHANCTGIQERGACPLWHWRQQWGDSLFREVTWQSTRMRSCSVAGISRLCVLHNNHQRLAAVLMLCSLL